MDKTYISIYGAKTKITAAQYISELICKKMADINTIKLPNQFWNDRDKWIAWAKKFKNEIIAANSLLKLYEAKAIINSLQSSKAKKIQSLFNKKLHDIIQQEQNTLNHMKSIRVETKVNSNTKSVPINRPGNKSKISKLRD